MLGLSGCGLHHDGWCPGKELSRPPSVLVSRASRYRAGLSGEVSGLLSGLSQFLPDCLAPWVKLSDGWSSAGSWHGDCLGL